VTDDTIPRFVPVWLSCKACGHWWDDWQPTNVPLDTWAAHVTTWRCPSCGADSGQLLLRTTPLDERPA
jgi:rubredoxin